MMSCRRMGAMNCIASMATVATGPNASLAATMPPAISIWLKTQPPKMWPFVLMSPGRGTVRNMGSRPADPLVFGSIVIIHFPFQRIVNLLVMASATGKKNQAHKRCRQHHGQARSEEHTSELQSLLRISYAVFCLKKKNTYSTYQQHKEQILTS